MPRKTCSIVLASYQRGHLLRRSVEGYNRLHFPLGELEVVVVDDGSTDDTAAVCDRLDPRIDVKYVRLRKTPGLWRDCAAVINVGLRASHAECVIATHPEMVPGRRSVAACVDAVLANPRCYACCRAYYLTPRDTDLLDTVPWVEEGPPAVRQLPGFYDDRPGHPDYHPRAVEKIPAWESWVFGGHHRNMWKTLGGFIQTELWGSVDLAYHHRRRLLGIPNVTATGDDTICLHVNHDSPGLNVPTPRDIGKAHAEAGALNLTETNCRYPAIDNLW